MKVVVGVFVLIPLFLLLPSDITAQVKINEFVPDSSPEWIEFYNASDSADYIKNYYIDDDPDFESDSGSSSKKTLSGLITSNPTFPYIETSSFLNNSGDFVVLFDQTGILIDQYHFDANPGKDISIGRYPDYSGNISILSYLTKADANAVPTTPTPEPTPPPTFTPTPSPTQAPQTVTPMPIKSSTPKVTVKPSHTPTPDSSAVVLGAEDVSETITPSPSTDPTPDAKNKFPYFAVLIIIIGLILAGLSVILAYKKNKTSTPGSLV